MSLPDFGGPKLVVVLTDSTDVAQVQGAFKARKKEMSMAALIPGLPVQVEGTYNDRTSWWLATSKVQGQRLEQAQAIQAGVHETQQQAAAEPDELTAAG